jgi:hypothetical protein
MTKKGYFEGPSESRTYSLPYVLVTELTKRAANDAEILSEIVCDALCKHFGLDKAEVLKRNAELIKA